MSQVKGKISQIIGPVIDVNFENADKLPNLLEAIEIIKEDGSKVILECQKHIGEDVVRQLLWILPMVLLEEWKQPL